MEGSVPVGEARRPDPTGVGVPAQVELARAGEGLGRVAPMDQIAGGVDPDPGPPLEGGGGEEIVLPDAQERRIGVESGEDGVLNIRHAGSMSETEWRDILQRLASRGCAFGVICGREGFGVTVRLE